MSSTIYQVVVTREGDHWLADVPDLPGTHTYARTLAGLEREVREAIAAVLDLPDGAEPGLMLDLDVRTGDQAIDVGSHTVRVRRAQLSQAERELNDKTMQMVMALRTSNYSVRDVAKLLGISPQRVSQVMNSISAEQPTRTE